MTNLLGTALGLGFTVFVCFYAMYTLLSPWLDARRRSKKIGDDTGKKHATPAHGATPFSPA